DAVHEIRAHWPTFEVQIRRYARRRAPSDEAANDLMQDALRGVLEGSRRWNRATTPDLFTFLCGVIRSESSHGARRAAARPREMSLTDDGSDIPSSSLNPEKLLAKRQEAEELASLSSEVFPALQDELGEDAVAQAVLDRWLGGVD